MILANTQLLVGVASAVAAATTVSRAPPDVRSANRSPRRAGQTRRAFVAHTRAGGLLPLPTTGPSGALGRPGLDPLHVTRAHGASVDKADQDQDDQPSTSDESSTGERRVIAIVGGMSLKQADVAHFPPDVKVKFYGSPKDVGRGGQQNLMAAIKNGGIDEVYCLTRYNSHSTTRMLQRLCRKQGTPFLMLANNNKSEFKMGQLDSDEELDMAEAGRGAVAEHSEEREEQRGRAWADQRARQAEAREAAEARLRAKAQEREEQRERAWVDQRARQAEAREAAEARLRAKAQRRAALEAAAATEMEAAGEQAALRAAAEAAAAAAAERKTRQAGKLEAKAAEMRARQAAYEERKAAGAAEEGPRAAEQARSDAERQAAKEAADAKQARAMAEQKIRTAFRRVLSSSVEADATSMQFKVHLEKEIAREMAKDSRKPWVQWVTQELLEDVMMDEWQSLVSESVGSVWEKLKESVSKIIWLPLVYTSGSHIMPTADKNITAIRALALMTLLGFVGSLLVFVNFDQL